MTALDLAIDATFERRLDHDLSCLPCFGGAIERRHAPLLPRDFVLAANYLKSFPQHGFTLDNAIQPDEQYLLSPTCCYPVFHALRGTTHAETTLITHKNLCFRCEDYYETGTRQISYMMREYIMLSPDLDRISAWIEDVKTEVATYLTSLGVKVEVEIATDPFFNANDYKQKFQRDQNLKSEFVVNGVACGSVNLHLRAFAKACAIESDDGAPMYTACFGLGYDRIYHQFLLAQQADTPATLEPAE